MSRVVTGVIMKGKIGRYEGEKLKKITIYIYILKGWYLVGGMRLECLIFLLYDYLRFLIGSYS